MSLAFEITNDDILNVVHRMGFKVDSLQLNEIADNLDYDAIECTALIATEIEEQTELAYSEIRDQIKKMNIK